MASPTVTIRFPAELLTKVDAEAARIGIGRSELVLDILAEKLTGYAPEEEPAPRSRPGPPRSAAKAGPLILGDARAALAHVEARVGVKAILDSVPLLQAGKRPAYQKGQAGPGKARGR